MTATSGPEKHEIARRLIQEPRHLRAFMTICFFVLAALIVAQGAISWYKGRQAVLDAASERQFLSAKMAAAVLSERLNRLSDMALSFSTRVRMRELVASGDWDGAIAIFERVPVDFPVIERVFLADPTGVLKADTPALTGVRGQDFSHRDWYQGVSRTWTPYVSEVYQRQAEPRINVIAIAAPVKADDGRAVGILVLQIPLEKVYSWTTEFDFGRMAEVTFVDHKGRLASAAGSTGEIADLTSRAEVQRIMKGGSGVIAADGGMRIIAYAAAAPYGWGVIVEQPTAVALAAVGRSVTATAAVQALFLVVYLVLCLALMRVFDALDEAYRREKYLTERLPVAADDKDDAMNAKRPFP